MPPITPLCFIYCSMKQVRIVTERAGQRIIPHGDIITGRTDTGSVPTCSLPNEFELLQVTLRKQGELLLVPRPRKYHLFRFSLLRRTPFRFYILPFKGGRYFPVSVLVLGSS